MRELGGQVVFLIAEFRHTHTLVDRAFGGASLSESFFYLLAGLRGMGMGQQNLAHFHTLFVWIDPDHTHFTMQEDAPNFVAERKYFTTIDQAQPIGEGEHVSIGTELANVVIVQCVERLAT